MRSKYTGIHMARPGEEHRFRIRESGYEPEPSIRGVIIRDSRKLFDALSPIVDSNGSGNQRGYCAKFVDVPPGVFMLQGQRRKNLLKKDVIARMENDCGPEAIRFVSEIGHYNGHSHDSE